MDDETTEVEAAINRFREVRKEITENFGVHAAEELVRLVLSGAVPRKGHLASGFEYFVHGIGYTVVVENDAQVHLDAGDGADCFKAYDIQFYLDDVVEKVPNIERIAQVCGKLVDEGVLGRLGPLTFSFA